MTTSPKDFSNGSTPSREPPTSSGENTAGSAARSSSTTPTTSRGEKPPHGLKGRPFPKRVTPDDIARAKEQMLETPYDTIVEEFKKAVAESKEKKPRRPSARRNPVTLAMVEREYRKALGEMEQ